MLSTTADNSERAPISPPRDSDSPKEMRLSCLHCRSRKLKCDRGRPSCGRCITSGRDCSYPCARQRYTSKTRNVKELNERLAQLEGLINETRDVEVTRIPTRPKQSSTVDWNHLIQEDDRGNTFNLEADIGQIDLPLPDPSFTPNELLPLGQFEQLPPPSLIEDLTNIYFDELHHATPMLQQSRYTMSLYMPAHMRPPMCLQYALMALAASNSESYEHLAMPFYQRARNYAEADEMKGLGENFITLAHAQCLALLANFEARNLMFSRAAITISRSVRLAQILGLHCLDTKLHSWEGSSPTIPQPKDWCELEERRRTFWVIFLSDRIASSTSGWPPLINPQDIETNLPASEKAFVQGVEESTSSLMDTMRQNLSAYSPFAGKILVSHIFGWNLNHSFKNRPEDNPEDVKNGSYWKRHKEIDNALSTMFMSLPDNLRLPRHSRDQNAVFVNLNLHSSIICLHRAAVGRIKQLELPANMLKRSQERLLPAAEEILSIMRAISHINGVLKSPFVGFSAYTAASVFLDDFRTTQNHESEVNLDFLLDIMVAAAKQNPMIRSLTMQLAFDMKRGGLGQATIEKVKHLTPPGQEQNHSEPPLLGKHHPTDSQVLFCPLSSFPAPESSAIIAQQSGGEFSGQGLASGPDYESGNWTTNDMEMGSEPVSGFGTNETLSPLPSVEPDLYLEGSFDIPDF